VKRAAVAVLGVLAACRPSPATMSSPDTGSINAMTAIRGLELYADQGCAACHCNSASGGCNLSAPNIQGQSLEALNANLRFATTALERPDENDPVDPHPFKLPNLSDQQIEDLAAFLGSLSGGTPIENETLIAKGFGLYISGECISCHLMSAQGVNQGGLGSPIAGVDPDNLFAALSGRVPCHPYQRHASTSSTSQCSLLGQIVTNNPTVEILTDTPPPDADKERAYLSYFLAFISPPPSSGVVDPCNDVAGEICTVAGNGVGGYTGDGVRATDALLYYPQGLELTDWNRDGRSDLVIADWNNHRIRTVFLDQDTDGVWNRIETIAGNGKVQGTDALNHPVDVAFDANGNLIVAGWHNQNIYRYIHDAPPGTQRDQPAGVCDLKCTPDETPTLGRTTPLGLPSGIEVLPDGSYLVSENACGRIRQLTVGGDAQLMQPNNCIDPVRLFVDTRFDTIAGQRQLFGYAGDGGPARFAKFNSVPAPTVANFGISLERGPNPRRLYIADSGNNVIRYVDLSVDPPTIQLLAGTPGTAGFKDGLALQAKFNFPVALYAHTDGAVYVADNRNHVVRKIKDGVVTTVAGTGRAGFNGDNQVATKAQLSGPSGVILHPDGRLFISDTNNNRVRVVRP